jgi:hypothetical protein
VHTNPIILSFCSLLYYKDLSEHLRRFKIEKAYAEKFIGKDERIKMATFTGRVPPVFHMQDSSSPRRTAESIANSKFNKNNRDVQLNLLGKHKKYNQFIVNKWHVIAMLDRNKTLIRYRKHFVAKKEEPPVVDAEPKLGMVQKVKNLCCCCNKEKQQNAVQATF